MPIIDAILCDICGMYVALNEGKMISLSTYGCYNCCGCKRTTIYSSLPIHYTISPLTPKWIEAIGLVSFDLELGQRLTHLYPPLPFSYRQETDLAFLCFPDVNNEGHGEYLHNFIFQLNKRDYDNIQRKTLRKISSSSFNDNTKEIYDSSKFKLEIYSEEYFCSSFYRQKKDISNQRGTQQKSIVILSLYGFPQIFENILGIICNNIFDNDNTEKVLQDVYNEISSWPPPLPTKQYSKLTLLGEVLSDFVTPCYTGVPFGPIGSSSNNISEVFSDTNLFNIQQNLLKSLEDPLRNLSIIQNRLNTCVLGSRSINGIAEFIEEKLKNNLDVTTWKECDFIDVIEIIRMSKFDKFHDIINSEVFITTKEENIEDEDDKKKEKNKNINSDISNITSLFRHINYISYKVAIIQDKELLYCRKVAKKFLHNTLNSSVILEESAVSDIFSEFDIYTILFPHLNRLWKIWELLITGESICVVGTSVNRVTSACFCLYSLLTPLSLNAIIRPYVTINNSEIDILKPTMSSDLPVLVGATNPFFVRHWIDWPHFIFLGNKEKEELQTHKTLPHSSPKRSKHQFDMKTNMFTSKHFLIKTEKHVWDQNSMMDFSPTRIRGSFLADDIINKIGNNSMNRSKDIRETFSKLTKQFLIPLENAVEIEFSKSIPNIFYSESFLSNIDIFFTLENSSNGELPLHMFKQRSDMFEVYRSFMKTKTYNSWLQYKIFTLKRNLIIQSNSLKDFLLLEPDPSRRYLTLMVLQDMLYCELKKPLLDVLLLHKLLDLTVNFATIRAILTR